MAALTRRRAGLAGLACGWLLLLLSTHPLCAQESPRGAIRFSWWGGPVRTAKTNAVIDLFLKHDPGVTVTREPSDFQAYWDRLSIQSAAHGQPCAISMQSRYIDQYARGSVLRPLDDLVASGAISLKGVRQSVIDTARQPDGKLYMIPYGVSTLAVFYNRSLLDRAGIAPPGPNWTWDDLAKIARAAQPKLPRRVYAIALLGGQAEMFFPWVLGHGEKVFTPNGIGFSKPTMIAWYRYWEDLRKAGVTQSAEATAEIHRSIIENSPIALGRVMIDEKPPNQFEAHLTVLKKATGDTLEMQKFPDGPKGSGEIVLSNGIGIGSNCNPNDTRAAAALIDFWEQNDEAAKLFASDNGLVAVDRQQDEQFNNPATSPAVGRQIRLTQEDIRIARPMLWPAYYNQFIDLLVRNYQAVSFGQMSIEAAVDQFFEQAAKLAKQ